VQIVVHKSG